VYDGGTPTKFGRHHDPRIGDLIDRALLHHAEPLKEVEWDVPVPVLDQEDLLAQGIDTSRLVPGAASVDALGSCTAQTLTEHVAERTTAADKDFTALELTLAGNTYRLAADAKSAEEFAIVFYHIDTARTDNMQTEWPPTDCGSTGQHCCATATLLSLGRDYIAPHNIQGALLALQSGTVMQGAPWFNAWMQPDSDGFVDGDGSVEAFEAAISTGVAGGHETLQRGIAQIGQLKSGAVDLRKTVIKIRNSWSRQFALDGDYLIHASTLDLLGHYVDYKQLVV